MSRINIVQSNFDYTPARLVKKGKYWFVLWYESDLKTTERIRIRKSFNINLIANKRERAKHGLSHVRRVNLNLAAGIFESNIKHAITKNGEADVFMSLLDAFRIALDIKLLADRKNTREAYKSTSNIFYEYIESKKISDSNIRDFTKKHALRYLDHLVRHRTIGPRTYNNYIINMRALFYELVRREIIEDNPFVGIKKRKTGKKIRRAFTDEEVDFIKRRIFGHDKFLSLEVVLIYHTMIRPVETRRLRFQNFDLKSGVIRMSGSITKNRDDAVVTIPDIILPWLRAFGFEKYPPTYLIFGEGGYPHPNIQIGHNTLNYRHRKILEDLKDKGLINNIDGLSLYSWKDTGDQKLARSGVNIISIRDHNRHKSLETTNVYMQNSHIRDPEIAGLEYTIIPM